MDDLRALLHRVADEIADHHERLPSMRVHPGGDPIALRDAVSAALPATGAPAAAVLGELVAGATPGLVATAGPRYFGFVVGGAVPASLCADLLATGWDQLAFNPVTSPAAAAFEDVAATWLKDLLGVPASASVGFVTGGQAANTVGLAAARHHVLHGAGWDVERRGLRGAPPVHVVAGVERHTTIDRSLRLLGLGDGGVTTVPADPNGAMDVSALRDVLDGLPAGPTIVCAQAGNVNTGACDDLVGVCDAAAARGAWVHVDGAFGLWAAAAPATRPLVRGIERADSWACDGHKWLNVPYDSGYVLCAHPDAHAGAMSFTAAYLVGQGAGGLRSPADYVPESSRRARGFATWAAIRSLGRDGVAELVERCCRLARRAATALDAVDGIGVANDVVLNQVLVRVGDDERTDRVLEQVQADGTCWLGGTTWRGTRLLRLSVSSWATGDDDIERTVDAIVRAARATS